MKKLLFISLLLLAFGCKKDKAADQLSGDWEYRGTACFCVRTGVDNTQPGNGSVISFSNGTYNRLNKGQVIKSGTYTIVQEKLGTANANRLIYDNDVNATKTFFKIENSRLTIYGEIPIASDGSETYYDRL